MLSYATTDRLRPGPARRRRWAGRIAHIAEMVCRSVWADILSGFAAHGAALAGRRLDHEQTGWTEADLDVLLEVPEPRIANTQRKPVP